MEGPEDLQTRPHSMRRQARKAGSIGEGTREKAAYAHKAVGEGTWGVCREHCRGAKDGCAVVKGQRAPSEKIRTLQGCGPHRSWLPRRRQGSSPSAAGWLGRLQTARYDDWGWENLSMERRGLGATAARNLAVSLLHDIMLAGRGQAGPSARRAAWEGKELVQAAASACSSPAEPPSPGQPSKEKPPPERQVHSDTRPFGSQAVPQPPFPCQKYSGHHWYSLQGGQVVLGVLPGEVPAGVAPMLPRQSWGPGGV